MAVQRVKNSKGEWVIVNGTGGVILDTGMSDTSPNAVQNKVIKKYVDNKVESVSPLYVNIGMDFPNETATGTLPDLEISFSDILSAAEGKRDIWIVVSDGTAYQCLVTYLSENSGGIAIRAYKHEVNEANFSTIAIAFVDGAVPIWHSNFVEFQEKLVSGENLATVNGQSLLEGGNIEIVTEEKEVYIGSDEPTDDGAKLWVDPTGTPSSPSAGVEVIDNLESESTTAALSANQGRVLKEMIGQGGGEVMTIYALPYQFVSELESQMGIQIENLPFYGEMCSRNAMVYSQIVNNGLGGTTFVVDAKTYLGEFFNIMMPESEVFANVLAPAIIDYSNFTFIGGVKEPEVQVTYRNLENSSFETFVLHSDGTLEYKEFGNIAIHFGELLLDADIATNKLVYDNWDKLRVNITEVRKRETEHSYTTYPVMGKGSHKDIYILRSMSNEGAVAFCRVTLTETGIPIVSPSI